MAGDSVSGCGGSGSSMRSTYPARLLPSLVAVLGLHGPIAGAEEPGADLAKQLANPLAALISVPIQANYDENIGPAEEGERWLVNIQPVIPVSLSEDWNLISRTILPVIAQKNLFPGAGSQSGIGDVVQSVFFSPQSPTAGGWIWGVGPVLLLPTGSDERLTADKWGVGPTAVALKQVGPWTYGALANHIVSFAGKEDRADINATYLQPFVAYVTATKTTFGFNTESTYDWEATQWSVPVNFTVSQMLKVGRQPLQLAAGVRYWVDGPVGGADGWGARLGITLLFPK